MQSIRLLVIVFIGTVILCGALLMIGCGDSSSGGSSASYSLNCILSNVKSPEQCTALSSGNSCQNLPSYDPSTKTCYTNACFSCSN